MANNSTFKKYAITQLPISPSQIAAGSFADTGVTSINYQQVGKLYFTLYAIIGGLSYPIGGTTGIPTSFSDSLNRVVTKLGLGFQTNFGFSENAVATTGPVAYWNGATWTFESGGTGNQHQFLTGILVS